jgi:hypothetical protein
MQTPFIKLQGSRTVVATAGQRVQLNATSTPCGKLTITALKSNTGEIVFGDSTIVAAFGSRNGTPLEPMQSVDIPIDDLSKVWLDAEVSGEGVSYTWLS